jgi:hypothetical protein
LSLGVFGEAPLCLITSEKMELKSVGFLAGLAGRLKPLGTPVAVILDAAILFHVSLSQVYWKKVVDAPAWANVANMSPVAKVTEYRIVRWKEMEGKTESVNVRFCSKAFYTSDFQENQNKANRPELKSILILKSVSPPDN